MPEYFVYGNAQYYPSGVIVEAKNSDEAYKLAEMSASEGALVVEVDNIEFTHTPDGAPMNVLDDLRAEARWLG